MKNLPARFTQPLTIAPVLMAAALGTGCTGKEDETDIPLSEVPANIVNIVHGILPGIALSKAEKEVRHDRTIYELEGNFINSLKYEIEIAADGTIIKIELDD